MTILITGATGNIGRRLVNELLERGVAVRALSRAAAAAELPDGVAVYEGSLATTPDQVFDHVDAVYLFPADEGVAAFVDRAIAAGVSRFVVLSSLAVSARNSRDVGSASELHHRAVEEVVTTRTDDWTILRPGNLATNLLSWSFAVRAGHGVRVPYPTSSQVLIHEADVATAAAIVLTEPGHSGRIYELTGPASLTKIEQLSAVADAIGCEVPLIEVTPDEFREDVGRFIPEGILDMLLGYWSETIEEPEEPLAPPLGITPTPLSQWAVDHRSAFAS
ncbi:SDR family oxidoreductase [Microbacterium sp. P5_E9]